MSNSPATKYFAIGIAAVVLAFGAYLVGRSNTTATTATDSAQTLPAAGAQRGAPLPQTGQGGQGGQLPPGAQNGQGIPVLGTPVTGATAAKLDALVTAKYPGQIERTMKLDDGSYVVHVITSTGEIHVAVSRQFKITGSDAGGPGGGGQPAASSGASGVQS